jgi:predicted transcriptional regulator
MSDANRTPKQQEAWDLHERGLGVRKIAERLGISTSAVRQRLHPDKTSAYQSEWKRKQRAEDTPYAQRKREHDNLFRDERP